MSDIMTTTTKVQIKKANEFNFRIVIYSFYIDFNIKLKELFNRDIFILTRILLC